MHSDVSERNASRYHPDYGRQSRILRTCTSVAGESGRACPDNPSVRTLYRKVCTRNSSRRASPRVFARWSFRWTLSRTFGTCKATLWCDNGGASRVWICCLRFYRTSSTFWGWDFCRNAPSGWRRRRTLSGRLCTPFRSEVWMIFATWHWSSWNLADLWRVRPWWVKRRLSSLVSKEMVA